MNPDGRPVLAERHYSADWFCLPHNRFEPEWPSDFMACLECGHVYRSASELVDEENKIRHRLGQPPLLLMVDPLREVLAQIPSCPLCTHDW